MLRPSYAELMEVLNKDTEDTSEITSRYTIVIAAAKRARQLIDGDEPMVEEKKGKPLSTAVEEIYEGKIKVVPEGQGTVLHLKNEFNEEEFFDGIERKYQKSKDAGEKDDMDSEAIDDMDDDADEIDDELIAEIDDDDVSDGEIDDEQ